MFDAFLMGWASGLATSMSVEAAKAAFSHVARKRPDLANRAAAAEGAANTQEIEAVFRDAVGVIDACAATGEILIDRATLEALRGIRFDHAHGHVSIAGSQVSAPILVTGGGEGATGTTNIGGNTSLKSKRTEIRTSENAGIVIRGDASMKQT